MTGPDHHSQYIARAVAALSPERRRRVDELFEQLAQAAGGRERLVRFAKAREAGPRARRSRCSRTSATGADLVPIG